MSTTNFEIALRAAGLDFPIEAVTSVGGGSINEAFCLKGSGANLFAKRNRIHPFPAMFQMESMGLELLAQSSTLRIPKVHGEVEVGDEQYLFLEWVETGPKKTTFWEEFGQGLARLHATTNHQFGLLVDNYIGSLPQSNPHTPTWTSFFREQRLMPLIKRATDQGRLDAELIASFDRVMNRLEDFFPEEEPSLLHGDLWSGNFMVDDVGAPVLIDPAVYFGHRYMDLGMTRLFGGFDAEFYEAYWEAAASDREDWQTGCDIANLYPLLVHVVLFGGSYAHQIRQVLKKHT